MKICRVRKCNVERPVLPYFCSKLFELQVPFLNFLNLFGVLDPCDCGFPKLGPKTSMIFADTREFTRSNSMCYLSSVCQNRYVVVKMSCRHGLSNFSILAVLSQWPLFGRSFKVLLLDVTFLSLQLMLPPLLP